MKKSNFSDFEPNFFLFGGVVTKNAFSKMFLTFWYASFDTSLILWQHPQQVFYDLKNNFLKIFGKSIFFDFFDVFTPSLQVWWNVVENWWRNDLSKLTTFNPVFQLLHSAMHCAEVVMENGIWFSSPFWARVSLSLSKSLSFA